MDQAAKPMDSIMALCKRRGFIYQASEIYGGINGFWDYGPLGAQLKKNLRDAWWEDVVMTGCRGSRGPDGKPIRILPLETCIIQNPKVWEASGHVRGFNDPMVDCRETKMRYRADHLWIRMIQAADGDFGIAVVASNGSEAAAAFEERFERGKPPKHRLTQKYSTQHWRELTKPGGSVVRYFDSPMTQLPKEKLAIVFGPDANEPGTLTEPRQFNLMFKTTVGATGGEDDVAYLRPETAQGIFINFKNVLDTMRVKIPFGIANTGKAFRNEVTPRNFTFRSREFEQAECEFFCHPDDANKWYEFWRDWRLHWWESLGLKGDNLQLREHEKDELSHYSSATCDVEYRFPFTAPGFGELEGVANRGCFDLTQHQNASGQKLDYFDQERNERYIPHVIEPAAGLDRGVLAILCEAYTRDDSRPSPELLRLHPRLAPIKAAVFPLVNKDGMPEIGEKLHAELTKRFARIGFIEFDPKQSIGKRYARMDEAGCPFCFTIDSQTITDQTVTVRHRDTGAQDRIAIDQCAAFLSQQLGL